MDAVLKILNEIKEDLKGKATQEQINNLLVEIQAKDVRIKQLEDRLAFMENIVQRLEIKSDDNEQYHRRLDLRINNIPFPTNGVIESSQDYLAKVKNTLAGIGVDIPDYAFDRAHRIGKPKLGENNVALGQQMIVRFTSWDHRTNVYKNRGSLRAVKIYLDLTKRGYDIRKHAIEKVKNNPKIDFVFANVNCALGMRCVDGSFRFFSTVDELDKIVQSLST